MFSVLVSPKCHLFTPFTSLSPTRHLPSFFTFPLEKPHHTHRSQHSVSLTSGCIHCLVNNCSRAATGRLELDVPISTRTMFRHASTHTGTQAAWSVSTSSGVLVTTGSTNAPVHSVAVAPMSIVTLGLWGSIEEVSLRILIPFLSDSMSSACTAWPQSGRCRRCE